MHLILPPPPPFHFIALLRESAVSNRSKRRSVLVLNTRPVALGPVRGGVHVQPKRNCQPWPARTLPVLARPTTETDASVLARLTAEIPGTVRRLLVTEVAGTAGRCVPAAGPAAASRRKCLSSSGQRAAASATSALPGRRTHPQWRYSTPRSSSRPDGREGGRAPRRRLTAEVAAGPSDQIWSQPVVSGPAGRSDRHTQTVRRGGV